MTDDWDDISTLPHDRSWVLLYATLGVQLEPNPGIYIGVLLVKNGRRAFWSAEGQSLSHVTHWMPLPSPPQL